MLAHQVVHQLTPRAVDPLDLAQVQVEVALLDELIDESLQEEAVAAVECALGNYEALCKGTWNNDPCHTRPRQEAFAEAADLDHVPTGIQCLERRLAPPVAGHQHRPAIFND